jgi:lysophospholipid acyltransferase (LPLAT)-like uncharacterized protein
VAARRRPPRLLPRTLRRRLSGPLLRVGARLLPPLYLLYMGLVWRTSRVEDGGLFRLHGVLAEHGSAVALLWHEEVLGVAYAYPHLGFRPHTLASRSNAGELVTRLLERCGYGVFRGGASSGRSRRRAAVWRRMIRHMRSADGVLYGLTVDGSRGPAYRLKRGALVLARECGAPVVLVRTWYARSLRLPTWDRSALPLPFNRIRHAMRGPYAVPAEAHSRAGLETFRRRLEEELLELAAESYAALGLAGPAALRKPAETA